MAKKNRGDELKEAINVVLDILLDAPEKRLVKKRAGEYGCSIEDFALAGLFTGMKLTVMRDVRQEYLDQYKSSLSRITFDFPQKTQPKTK